MVYDLLSIGLLTDPMLVLEKSRADFVSKSYYFLDIISIQFVTQTRKLYLLEFTMYIAKSVGMTKKPSSFCPFPDG